MNALAQLLEAAGQPPMPDGFAGYCPDCGRGTYKRGQTHLAETHGWVYRATVYRCMSCYTRLRRKQSAKFIEYVSAQEAYSPPIPREQLRQEAADLRKAGMSIYDIGMRIGRSERVVSKMLQECGMGSGRVRDGRMVCLGCGQQMRFRSEPESAGVLKHGRGRCRKCSDAYRRQANRNG